MSLIVAGGVYQERCLSPNYNALLGSAGRAAAAVAALSPGVHLHSFYPTGHVRDVELAFAPYGVVCTCYDSPAIVGFEYLHPLSSPRIYPIPLPQAAVVEVSGDVILRFGCLEGTFRVSGRRVVYDPQSGSAPAPFRGNGSTANELAIVLNRTEMTLLTGENDPIAAVRMLHEHHDANVVVIKMDAAGALVSDGACDPQDVPAYRSSAVNKIGSGDVFSGTFAHFWGERSFSAAEAADIASRYTSQYVEDRCIPCDLLPPTRDKAPFLAKPVRIYLGGPFFNTPQVWLIEEARSGLMALGAEVFSPMHEVGFGSAEVVAVKDLDALNSCSAMLALLTEHDPGTLFEVGHARACGIPVVALMQGERDQDRTMLVGTGCALVSDLASALYLAVWAGAR